ncbi:nuclease-related domain-containing protein [Streptacidiphilus sp. EB103A]|uniref:nuclease-related domain-containing protein n=1 Tax=Streptacidiphilus sp. EB103A TaxID=3156275 RepID=UPI0035174526
MGQHLLVAPNVYDRPVSDYEYIQRIRRHQPSSLLPLVAAAAAQYASVADPDHWMKSPYRQFTPWALADVARVAFGRGTEHNRTPATDRDLLEILAAYSALADPAQLVTSGENALEGFLLRITGAQLAWQTPEFHALARTAALFRETAVPADKTVRCLVPGWEEKLFGCSLPEYVGTVQLLWGAAVAGQGQLPQSWFDSPEAAEISQHLDKTTITKVIEDHLAVDQAGFKDLEEAARSRASAQTRTQSQARRFTYNPVRECPVFRDVLPGALLIPSPQLMWHKASPAGVYFSGLAGLGKHFPIEVGYLFEQYVGRQLRLLPDAEVFPEVRYKDGKDTADSIDWFVVFDDLVLLVEVKSAMPTEALRLGQAQGLAELTAKLGHAHEQLEKSATAVRTYRADFAHIPTDRPLIGMAVTLEPFHLVNSPFLKSALPTTSLPVLTASSYELELLVTVSDTSVPKLLLDRQAAADQSTYSLKAALGGHQRRENSVLAAGWRHYPWGRNGTVAAAHQSPTPKPSA